MHVFGYDDLDQLGGYAPPSVTGGGTGLTDYAYNRDRQLEQVTRPNGAIIDPQYDTTTGLLHTLASPEGATAYTWLAGGRVDTIGAPGGNALDYDYDGPLPTRVVSSGAAPGTVAYTYDTNFWLDTVSAGGSLVDYSYDNDGLLTSAKVGTTTLTLARKTENGLLDGITVGQMTDTWTYSGFGEPSTYSAKLGTATQFSAGYTRDDLGRIDTRTEAFPDATRIETYGYDIAGRLDTVHVTGALASDYRFDANGNREEHRIGAASKLRGRTLPCLGDLGGTTEVLIVGQYDAQDRMTAYGTCSYRYTANGELEQRTDTTSAAITTYRYDVFGNLREATLPNQTRVDYDIDGRNRRIGKRVNGVRVQGFLYLNQLEPIAELDGSGNVVASFVYADRSNTPSLMLKSGKTYRVIADHLGSVRLVIDIATGTIAQRRDYDEYGNVVQDTNPGFQPFGYAGGIHDSDTGLVRFGARDYDPTSGRWTAKDPIGFAGGDSNLFAYVGGNPINAIDAEGLVVRVVTSDAHAAKILQEAYARLTSTRHGSAMCQTLESSPDVYEIRPITKDAFYCPPGSSDPTCGGKTRTVFMDPYNNVELPTSAGSQATPKAVVMAHELGHALGTRDDGPGQMNNVNANENPVRAELGLPARTTYAVPTVVWVPGTH